MLNGQSVNIVLIFTPCHLTEPLEECRDWSHRVCPKQNIYFTVHIWIHFHIAKGSPRFLSETDQSKPIEAVSRLTILS